MNTPFTVITAQPDLSPKPRPLWQRLTTGFLLASTLLVQTGQVLAQYNSAGSYIPGNTGNTGNTAPNTPPFTGYAPNGQLYLAGQPYVEPQAHIDARNVANSTLFNVSAQGLSVPTAANPNFVHQTLSDIDAAAANPGGGVLAGQVRSATVIYFTQPNNIYGVAGALNSPPVVPTGVNPATYQPLLNYNTYKDILANAPGAGYQSVVAPPNAPGTTPVPYVNGPYLIKAASGSDAAMAAMLFYKSPLTTVFEAAQVNQTPTGRPATIGGGIGGGVAVNLNQSQTQINHLSALSGGLVFASTAQLNLNNSANNPNNNPSNNPNSPNYNPNSANAQNAWDAFNALNSLSFSNNLGYFGRQGQYVALDNNSNNGIGDSSPSNSAAERLAQIRQLQAQAQKLDKREGYQIQANSLDLSGFAPNSLFGEGYNLFQYNPQLNPNGAAQNEYLKRLQSGQLQEGSSDYMLAAQIAQDRYRQAFSERLETNKPLKYSVADAQRKANELKLNDINPNELFGQGFDLFKYNPSLRANGAAENELLAKLQSGQLSAGSADYEQANQIAQERLRVAYSQSLSPPEPKKVSKWKLIAAVVVGAVLTFVTAGAAAPFIASALTAVVGTAVAATSLVVTSIAGVIAGAVGAVASTTITTGSFSEGLKAGAKTLVSGSVKALVGAAIGFGFASLDLLGTAGTITGTISNIAVNTLSGAVSSTILGQGSFASNLKTAAISSVVDAVGKSVANGIGDAFPNADGKNLANYAAHAALGCASAAAKGGDCAAGALGAAAGEAAAATGFLDAAANSTIGRTLNKDEIVFFGGLVGGTAAVITSKAEDVNANFATGTATASNAVANNYLQHTDQALKDKEILACKGSTDCINKTNDKFNAISDAADKTRTDWCLNKTAEQCGAMLKETEKDYAPLAARDEELSRQLKLYPKGSPEYVAVLDRYNDNLRNLADYNGTRLDMLAAKEQQFGLSTTEQNEYRTRLAVLASAGADALAGGGRGAPKKPGDEAATSAKPPATSEGEANSVSGKKLADELAAAQRNDPLLGKTLPGANAPVTVTAEANIGGRTLVDTNQTARPTALAEPNKPTLIADLLPPGAPNSTMANAHAEMGVIQRAYDGGLTQGQNMSITVRGEPFCTFCSSSNNIIAAADRAGLNSIRIIDTANKNGLTIWTWTRPSDGKTNGWSKAQ